MIQVSFRSIQWKVIRVLQYLYLTTNLHYLADFQQLGIFHLVFPVYANESHNFTKFCFFEVITSPLYRIVIYSCTKRQMIPQSFTQRLYILFLILSTTFESKLQLGILDAKPQVVDTTVVYGFNPVKSNCY